MTGAEAVGVGLGFIAIVAPDFWPKMPRALSYTLAGIGLSWLTYSGILGIEALSHTKLQYGPLAAIIAGAILVACGLFWHIHRITNAVEQKPDAHTVTDVENQKAAPQLPAVLVECHIGEMPLPPKRFYALSLFPIPKESGGGGLVEYFTPPSQNRPGTVWNPFSSDRPSSAYRCQLTNYDAAPLFNIQIDMRIDFLKAVKRENGAQSGEAFLSRDWPIFITKIDAKTADGFVFYVFNTTEHFVRVSFPEFGTAQQLDDASKRIRLIRPPAGFEMLFVPFDHPQPESSSDKK
jgi:hypothetical protein